MKKTLALSAFALILMLPLVSSAGTLTSSFLGSTSGTSSLGFGDTITLEVSVNFDNAVALDTFFFSLSGDVTTATALGNVGQPWAGVASTVSNWQWNYKAGKGSVQFGTTGVANITPAPSQPGIGTPVLIGNGFFGIAGAFGDGTTRVIGTVTITTNQAGAFQGGGFAIAGLDTMEGLTIQQPFNVASFGYTVIPEPGTAILMVLGLGGLGVMGRKSRK